MADNLVSNPPVARAARFAAGEETRRSGLPGLVNGPADALRHVVWAAELRRRYGFVFAAGTLEANEIRGDLWGGQAAAARAMDGRNNAIGLRIGGTALTYEEVVSRARDAVRAGLAHRGTGAGGTPVWRPREEWADLEGLRDRSPDPDEMPDWEPDPSYPYRGREHGFLRGVTPREREARHLADLGAVPPEAWSPEDVRAVIRSRPYADPNDRARAAWHARVRRFYEAEVAREAEGAAGAAGGDDGADATCGGTAEVRAHTRRGPSGRTVAVAAHERAVVCR